MATEILGVDEITESQADKYLTHNTANRQLEAQLVRVLDRDAGAVPGSPAEGDTYIVDTVSGAWASAILDDIAHFYSGTWKFYTPVEGLRVWVMDEDAMYVYDGAAWIVLAAGVKLDDNQSPVSAQAFHTLIVEGGATITDNGDGTATITIMGGLDETQFLRSDVDDTATGNYTVTGRWDVDNLRLDGNTLSTTNTNGNLTLQPDGNAKVFISTNGGDVLGLFGGTNPFFGMHDTGVLMFDVQAHSTSGLVINSYRNGTDIRLNARDTGGTDRNCITMNPDSAVNLFHSGSKVVETGSSGLFFGSGVSGANRATIFHDATHAYFRSFNTGGSIILQGETSKNVFIGRPTGATDLFFNAAKVVETNANGLVFGAGVSGTNRGQVYADATNVSLVNYATNGPVNIQGNGGTNLITGVANGAVDLYHSGSKVVETVSTGLTFGSGLVSNNRGLLDHNATNLVLANNVLGGNVTIRGSNAAASDRDMIVALPNGAVTLYNAGAAVVETFTNGLYFGTGVSGANRGHIYNDASDTVLFNNVNSGRVVLSGRNAGGTAKTLLVGNGNDSSLDLYFNGAKVVETTTNGIYFGSGVSGANAGLLAHTGTNLRIYNYFHGGEVRLEAEDAGGSVQALVYADPDSSVDLYHAGAKVVETQANGLYFGLGVSGNNRGGILHDSVNCDFRSFQTSVPIRLISEGNFVFTGLGTGAATLYHAGTARFATNSTGITVNTNATVTHDGTDLILDNNTEGGNVTITGTSGASPTQTNTLIDCDPDGATTLYHNNDAVLETDATGIKIAGSSAVLTYEEGTWTPTLTFATPGDLSVVYSTQTGSYEKTGRTVHVRFDIVTSTFTHTTASGTLRVSGLPFTVGQTSFSGVGSYQNINKAGFTQIGCNASGTTTLILFIATRVDGGAAANVNAADMASGTNVVLRGSVTYRV